MNVKNGIAGQTTPLKYRADIDGLRAIAVLSVVAFHGLGFKGGFIGVDIFFVISGFLISSILLDELNNKTFSLASFYVRRIRRIFPALILTLISTFVLGWYLLLPNELSALGKHLIGASIFTSNFFLWQESGYFDAAAKTKPLLHLWSLGIEEQFYIIWPLLLWGLWRKKINLTFFIIVLSFISFFANVYYISKDATFTFYFPHTRFWEILSGGLLAWLMASISKNNYFNLLQNPRNTNVLSITGTFFICFALATFTTKILFPGAWALLPIFGTLCIIAAGKEAWINKKILSNRIVVWIGLISFPLYLWHWPLLVYADLSSDDAYHQKAKCLAIIISIVLAASTYYLIERPIRHSKKILTIILSLLIGMCVIGYSGYYIKKKNGFPDRAPRILKDLNSKKYAIHYPLGNCFLMPHQDFSQFGDCGVSQNSHKKTIYIWGDSHAAHFYAGFMQRYQQNYNIVLKTAAGCPPIIVDKNFHTTHCQAINKNILELIRREVPYKVVLSAAWVTHHDWHKISHTIDALKSIGVKEIDLIGPGPWWEISLPRQIFLYNQKNHETPLRMTAGLRKQFFKLDPVMKKFANAHKINYISLANLLCNDKGCLTRLDNDTLLSVDYGHFTEPGSIYIVEMF